MTDELEAANDDMEERMELAVFRLDQWLQSFKSETAPAQNAITSFLYTQARLLSWAVTILNDPRACATAEWNRRLYEDVCGDGYAHSFTNPSVCAECFDHLGTRVGACFNWIATHIRDVITAAYEKDRFTVLIYLELFLEMEYFLSDADDTDIDGALFELIYYFIHDYDEIRIDQRLKRFLVPDKEDLVRRLVMEQDHENPDYLYEYGEYISDNERKILSFLNAMEESELVSMAATYTEGYRKGFLAAGIDLSKKKTVEIRFPIGFEPMVRQAVLQFEAMGLEPVFRRMNNTKSIGVVSTPFHRQYLFDHRFDEALYLNQALVTKRLSHVKKAFDRYEENALEYAGPAVIETFGEAQFIPEKKKEAPAYTDEQEKLYVGYQRDYALLMDQYIPGDQRSYTIIAYPIPEIGDRFRDIFHETVRLNNLSSETYQRIQQNLIDALDQGEYVRVLGRGDNRTDIRVMLHELKDPAHETDFENCVADVNIPVGEVFTSPVLKGTSGVLHVSYVYLNGLRYEDLTLYFEDGMVADYSCSNYEDEQVNRAYIRENILHNHDSLPIGEFAIGTNTTAYVMGRRFNIEDKLPILIAEKTGPHFAVGDTCYSMSEEVVLHNPDGKEIIAKDNECSLNRLKDVTKAYFQCHTDITIPYDEIGSISAFTKEGKEIIILRNGRFVLPGTEVLNEPLEGGDDR